MLYFLKKTLGQLLMPVPLMACLYVLGCLIEHYSRHKSTGKGLKRAALALFLICGYGIGADYYLYRLERTYSTFEGADREFAALQGAAVVVLGQGIPEKSDLPVRFQTGSPFQMRLMEGVRLYRKIPAASLYVSISGACEPLLKVRLLDEYAQEHGLNRANMHLITAARDTSDEARMALDLVKTNRLVLVTSATHLPRAVKIFAKEFERRRAPCTIIPADRLQHDAMPKGDAPLVVPAPCDFCCTEKPAVRFRLWPLPLPSVNGLNVMQHALYEGFGNLYESMKR